MNVVKIIIVILVAALLIGWVRATADVGPLPHFSPFLSGDRPSGLWDGAGILMLLIFIWGITRVARRDRE